jgi:hypothetical protein
MEPTAATACRDVLDRLRAQVNAHLPPVTRNYQGIIADSTVPLDRLPMIGTVVQQYIEAEAVYASANSQAPQDSQPTAG